MSAAFHLAHVAEPREHRAAHLGGPADRLLHRLQSLERRMNIDAPRRAQAMSTNRKRMRIPRPMRRFRRPGSKSRVSSSGVTAELGGLGGFDLLDHVDEAGGGLGILALDDLPFPPRRGRLPDG